MEKQVYSSILFKLLPIPKWVEAITLVNTIHFRYSVVDVEQSLVNHEMVHIKQIEKDGALKFYSKYLYYYIVNLIKYKNSKEAYMNIPYEKEAYEIRY